MRYILPAIFIAGLAGLAALASYNVARHVQTNICHNAYAILCERAENSAEECHVQEVEAGACQ